MIYIYFEQKIFVVCNLLGFVFWVVWKYVMNVEQMFEMIEEGFVVDVVLEVGLVMYLIGGRVFVFLFLILYLLMDIFVGNEVYI